MTSRSSLRPLDVIIRIAIVGLTLGTAYIHSTLGGLLFTLNAAGNLLSLRRKLTANSRTGLLYTFLLVASRADMDSRRKLNNLDPTVIFELIKLKASRDNIWLKLRGGNVYKQVGQPGVQIDVNILHC